MTTLELRLTTESQLKGEQLLDKLGFDFRKCGGSLFLSFEDDVDAQLRARLEFELTVADVQFMSLDA